MEIRNGLDNLQNNLCRQLNLHWDEVDEKIVLRYVTITLERLERILRATSKRNGYIWKADEVVFSPLHSVQYSIFLYLLSNTIYKSEGAIREADMVYYLNKIMHSCDWFYAIDLPEKFFAEHPLGSVMGRAKYGNNFFFYQGCTVGGSWRKDGNLYYPQIGNNVLMYSNSSILGEAVIGNNVIISANTRILGENIPDNSIVFGQSPNLIIKKKQKNEILQRQSHLWEKFDE